MKLRLSGKPSSRVRRGLGSLLKKVSRALGVKPCGGCNERARKLDRASDRLRF